MKDKFISTVLLLCVAAAGGQSIMDMIPCATKQANYSGPPLPKLPDQFATHIEANIVQENRTTDMREYYDYTNNRGVLEWYSRRTGERTKVLVDFNSTEAMTIYENSTCKYSKTNGSHTVFTFMSGANGTHIKSVKDLLEFGPDKGEVFVDGDKLVRGIPVNHWTSCFKMDSLNGTFNLDYYFTKGLGYIVDGNEVQVPIRAVLNGTGKRRFMNGTISDDVHSFYHVYEFFDFQPGPIKYASVFEVPVGVICNQGDIANYSKTAPQLSDHFSAGLETVETLNDEEVTHYSSQLYLDNAAQVYRMDTENGMGLGPPQQNSPGRPKIYINDRQNNVLYIIDKLEKNCSVSKTRFPGNPQGGGQMGPGAPGNPQGGSQMGPGGPVPGGPSPRPPTQFVDFFQDFSKFLFQGKKIWRGMDVETWGYVNTTTGEVTEVIFHNPQIHAGGMWPPQNDYEPVGVYKLYPALANQPKRETFEHMYQFSNGHPDPNIFDVSPCYAVGGHTRELAVDVTGNNAREIVKIFQKEFLSEIRQTLADAAKISVTRVSSMEWEEVRSSGTMTTFMVIFTLLDNKLEGVEGTLYSGPPLSTALDNLMQAINSGTHLEFKIQLATGKSVTFTVVSNSLWQVYSDDKKSSPMSTVPSYGAGSMAGLAIGMLIIGALLGLIGAYIIYKRFNTEVPYKVTD